MAMAAHAFADDLARGDIERRKQSRGSVALVVVGHRAGAALLQRKSGLGAIERLDLAFSSTDSTSALSGGSVTAEAPPSFWGPGWAWTNPSAGTKANCIANERESTELSHRDPGPTSPRNQGGAWQPTSACGAPLWMKMVAARADLSEPRGG